MMQDQGDGEVECPICLHKVPGNLINKHIDRGCGPIDDKPVFPPFSLTGYFGASQSQPTQSPQSRKRNAPDSSTDKPSFVPTTNPTHIYNYNPTSARVTTTHGDSIQKPVPQTAELPTTKKAKRNAVEEAMPLAERMRPKTLEELVGHEDLVGPNGVLRELILSDKVPSMILWSGPGMGKTTLARIIANTTKSRFKELSATSHGVNDVKKVFEEASNELHLTGRKTIIFMDEIHRFTKAQQDVFLPFVEKGTITLIGATTENPSFKVTSALLSRCRVFVLAPLTTEHVKQIIKRADEMMSLERDVKGLQIVSDELVDYLADLADGDGILLGFGELMVARNALNMFELTFSVALTVYQRGEKLTVDTLRPLLLRTQIVYDRKGDKHYDTISAFIKSMRHSDPDAAVYYLARMIKGGEDPLFIARRMVIFASEDVGLADPTMLPLAVSTFTATQQCGMPESGIMLSHCCIQLALARKSRASYNAYQKALSAVDENMNNGAVAPIPLHLRNAPTRLMKELGYGKRPEGELEFLPPELKGVRFLEWDSWDGIEPISNTHDL